ncbi:unnamed protein product [Amoebophrya sp. A25]|nr:unnamed protein product [Amoebophrya sp. A25]|eukprot:GSA25T00003548001.1
MALARLQKFKKDLKDMLMEKVESKCQTRMDVVMTPEEFDFVFADCLRNVSSHRTSTLVTFRTGREVENNVSVTAAVLDLENAAEVRTVFGSTNVKKNVGPSSASCFSTDSWHITSMAVTREREYDSKVSLRWTLSASSFEYI